ncbi:MAG: nucleotide exchange factor GrpE [Spirochaetales bacterium]|nr:nucleotide exchange factor GrpE [Spirochaetales bacterium]
MAEEIEAKETEQPVAPESSEAAPDEVVSEADKAETKKKKESKADREKKKLQNKIEKLEKALDESKAEVDELRDKYLRKQADFDNFRKRMLREKEDSIKFANTSLLMDIINVIDDFERALQSSEESSDFGAFHSGIEMIEKQMISMLETNWGLKRFDCAGEPFDPEKHEALLMEESDEYDVQTVMEDFMKGYILHDRVIRHAKVKVSKPMPLTE